MKRELRKVLLLGFSLLLVITVFAATITVLTGEKKGGEGIAVSQLSQATKSQTIQEGSTLHCFDWSYNTIKDNLGAISDAGFTAIQTSPVQQPKDYNASYKDQSGQWWKLYQPISFDIAQSSWLGTSQDLSNLCQKADDYGIKVVCDIVVNHLGGGTSVSNLHPGVGTYEPTIYNNYNTYFHSYIPCNTDNNIENIVRGNIGMPDLNTGNEYVQGRVISLLKNCIDCGVDGFRFDAAKHIETDQDGYFSSNFWNNVLSNAKSYAKNNKGFDLFVYGEILNTVGSGRNIKAYTKNMSVTDNKAGDNTTAGFYFKRENQAASTYLFTGEPTNKLVLWAESHDTYMGGSGSADGLSNTKGVSEQVINKSWAMIGSREGAMALYFARPSSTMGTVGSTAWKSNEVKQVNNFKLSFSGSEEYISSSNGVAINERYYANGSSYGAILSNVNGTSGSVNLKINKIGNGTYEDALTGNKFTVSNGYLSGKIGSTGIAVLVNTVPPVKDPEPTCNQASQSFVNSIDVTIGLNNATSGSYQINNGTITNYYGTKNLTLGLDTAEGEQVVLKLKATNGTQTVERTYTYTKTKEVASGFVYFDFTACSWFGNDGAKPMIKFDNGQYQEMGTFTNTSGQTLYYASCPSGTSKFTIARGVGSNIYNAKTFNFDQNKPLVKSYSNWNNGGSVNAYTGSLPGGNIPTPPVPVSEITLYFTNNKSWSKVYCYFWGGSESIGWPGTEMTYAGKNEYNQDLYKITLKADVKNIIFSNGNGSQTVDISQGIVNNGGFYLNQQSGSKWTVGTYTK